MSRRLLLVVGCVFALAGCGLGEGGGGDSGAADGGGGVGGGGSVSGSGGTESGGNVNTPDQGGSGPKTYALKDLSALSHALSPLDDGRVEISPPEKWNIPGRKTAYLAWFARFKPSGLPRIEVTVEDAPEGSPDSVTEENVEEFSKWLSGHVNQQLNEGEKLLEPVVPLVLGENAWGRYVRGGKLPASSKSVERQLLTTVQRGRMYTVELIVLGEEGELRKYRNDGYAVGAGMKFLAEGEGNLAPEGGFPAPDEPPPEDSGS